MKRANGEGNIRKRPDGRWEARIRIGNGERKYVMGKTQAEVRERLAKIIYDLDRGITPQLDERTTVGSTHLTAGTPVHEVQALLGHTSAATTLGFYAHVMPGSRDKNRETIERAFGNQNKGAV